MGIGAAVTALAVIGIAVAKSKPAQAAPSPAPPIPPVIPGVTPPNPATVTLQAGHRYSIAQLAPVPGMPVASVAQAQAAFDALAPGAIRVVSITQASGSTPTTLVVDVVSAVPFTLPATMPVTDLGLSPSSSTPSFTAVITDPNMIRQYQTILANGLTSDPTTAQQLGLSPSDYAVSDIDGDPNNRKWMKVLSAYQYYVNQNLPAAVAAGRLPAGYPSQLRTDGVLDYATGMAINEG